MFASARGPVRITALIQMYFGGPCVITISTIAGIILCSVDTLIAYGNIPEAFELNLSSLLGYWKADTPYLGVYGEAWIEKQAPLLSGNW